jgi:hypothetical protein
VCVEELSVSNKKPCTRFGSDIHQFVHQICKLFGHLGSPEHCYGNGAFRIYLKNMTSTGDNYFNDDKEYVSKAKLVVGIALLPAMLEEFF